MADDLLRKHLHNAMTSAEVTKLLGPPENILKGEKDGGSNRLVGSYTYSYFIGSWGLEAWDSTFIYVHFAETDRVISVQLQGY